MPAFPAVHEVRTGIDADTGAVRIPVIASPAVAPVVLAGGALRAGYSTLPAVPGAGSADALFIAADLILVTRRPAGTAVVFIRGKMNTEPVAVSVP